MVLGIAQATSLEVDSVNPCRRLGDPQTQAPVSAHTHPRHVALQAPSTLFLLMEWVLASSVKRKWSESLIGQGPLNQASLGGGHSLTHLQPACARSGRISWQGLFGTGVQGSLESRKSNTRHGRSS